MSNAVLDRRDWSVMTTTRRAALGGTGAALLVLVAVTCAVGALVPDVLSSIPERVLFGLIALFALVGAATLVIDLVRGN